MVLSRLDAHQAPPIELKDVFKKYQKMKPNDVFTDLDIVDFNRPGMPRNVKHIGSISTEGLEHAFTRFVGDQCSKVLVPKDVPIYEHGSLPGLLILPSLLPATVQSVMLSRLLHRDLSDPRHNTNLHLHYDIPYPENDHQESRDTEDLHRSFFSYSPSSDISFQPKDPDVHRPLPISKVMEKGLRWVTLGGQYDWTKKVYPAEEPLMFPADIRDLLGAIFPAMKAQAAIVNLYSPGDTLSLHRDVSEEVDNGLVSISMGCDCLFVVGLGESSQEPVVVYLRSGDAVFMSQKARFAWHGVPKIIPKTCPSYLESWPAESGQYEEWQSWMKAKRINLNVRQMRE